ncbi:MAG: PleD family two-component system response regulator, partial [Rhodospirillales bacterium]|nr:PleD family two-component system response regulator [Rhodospirillales bacterium]
MTARILVVDDMLPSVKMLAAKLSGEYYEVLTAMDGPSALDIIKEKQPDLILLDVMMPGMDGYEVCRKVKGDPETAQIPVVMVTALTENHDRILGLEAGADDFLTKPVNDLTLFARVRNLLRLKSTLDQWRLREETARILGLPEVESGRGAVSLDNPSVVVVNDSEVESENISDSISSEGGTIALTAGYDVSPATLAAEDPDVLVVGLKPEDDEALRLCSHVRTEETTRHLPILLIGDEDDIDRLNKALEIGVNDYLVRPVDDLELRARLRAQVRRKRYQDSLKESFLHGLSLATIDSLTGLHNRRYLDGHLKAMIARARDGDKPLAFLMIDIDHFKKVNDTWGHDAGDEVLREVSKRVANGVRGFDLVARYGGEEFVAVMPDTDLTLARAVAERLREMIEALPVKASEKTGDIDVTISIGVAML